MGAEHLEHPLGALAPQGTQHTTRIPICPAQPRSYGAVVGSQSSGGAGAMGMGEMGTGGDELERLGGAEEKMGHAGEEVGQRWGTGVRFRDGAP